MVPPVVASRLGGLVDVLRGWCAIDLVGRHTWRLLEEINLDRAREVPLRNGSSRSWARHPDRASLLPVHRRGSRVVAQVAGCTHTTALVRTGRDSQNHCSLNLGNRLHTRLERHVRVFS